MGEEKELVVGKDLITLSEASVHIAKSCLAEGDWSGMPVPVPELNLVLEPRYKHQGISDFRWSVCYDENGAEEKIEAPATPVPSEYRRVNSWWNSRYRLNVVVLKDKSGRARFTVDFVEPLAFVIRTMDAAAAWPIEAELKAQKRLAGLVPGNLFELYALTGVLPEQSSRSQVTYLFRRGRPTIALRQKEGEATIPLCALCLHPIGYYGDTWAGVMCPTDEVIAHLLMMRGSEEKFWANANQHTLDHPAAGL